MSRIDPEDLRQAIRNPKLPGLCYVLIWGELKEGTDAHRALSEVMFDYDATDDPDNAPVRDLSDVWVRQGVARCAEEYPEIREAAEKLFFPGMIEWLRRRAMGWWHRLSSLWCKDDSVIVFDDD